MDNKTDRLKTIGLKTLKEQFFSSTTLYKKEGTEGAILTPKLSI